MSDRDDDASFGREPPPEGSPSEEAPESSERAGARGRGSGGTGEAPTLPLPPRAVSRLQSLIDILDAEIPSDYRVELFRLVAPSLLPASRLEAPRGEGAPTPAGSEEEDSPTLARKRLDLAPYAPVLNQPGKNTLKALAALEAGRDQLGIDWMTPAEVERMLVERAGVRSVYRTNLSNALGKAAGLADRRRRGRGYEYRITPTGRESLHRELALAGE